MSDSKIRVRYAPSPTGHLHVGGVRTLLFNWFFARKNNGTFILRVEDTDRERSKPEYEKLILEDMKTLGLNYDEGPDVGGDYGPYRQFERFSIYVKYLKQLLEQDRAYYCFCSPEEIGQKRQVAMKLGRSFTYDGKCAKVSYQEALKRIENGEKASIRLRTPKNKIYVLNDLVKGQVEVHTDQIGDFLIARTPREEEQKISGSDEYFGMPVYNFSCVIDDYLMKMTHIIRGEDHLSNTSRQLVLYEALGWEPMQFAHTGMVLGTDRLKLSKRNGDVSTRLYLDKGYLPEALNNFLSLLGWWPPEGTQTKSGHPEILTMQELTQVFDMSGLQKSPAIFDNKKLLWMNAFYVRSLDLDDLLKRVEPFVENEFNKKELGAFQDKTSEWKKNALHFVRTEAELLSDLPKLLKPLLTDHVDLSEEGAQILLQEGADAVIQAFQKKIESSSSTLSVDQVGELIKAVGAEANQKGKNLFMPIRVSLTGQAHGPDLKEMMVLLGREAILGKIKHTLSQKKS